MWQSRKMFWMQESWLLQRWPLIPLHLQVELKFQQLRCAPKSCRQYNICLFLPCYSLFFNIPQWFLCFTEKVTNSLFPEGVIAWRDWSGRISTMPRRFPVVGIFYSSVISFIGHFVGLFKFHTKRNRVRSDIWQFVSTDSSSLRYAAYPTLYIQRHVFEIFTQRHGLQQSLQITKT